MKKTLLIGLALGAVAFTASSAFAGITGSAHDLSTNGPVTNVSYQLTGEDRICIFCHTPHNAVRAGATASNRLNGDTGATTTLSYSPLWNRDFTENQAYVMYNNGTGNGFNGTDAGNATDSRHLMNGQPAMTGISLLCMSCHDGVTAVNAFSSNNPSGASGIESDTSSGNGTTVMTGNRVIGKNAGGTSVGDLSNHHPIGMSWADSALDPEINPKDTPFIGFSALNNGTLTIADVLEGTDTMTCGSCHDVHNANDVATFLHTPNTNSQFCLTCHKK